MGNEVSKQCAVEPPPEWEPASNAKKFELVSPMSDLSDPSLFLHRRPHPNLSNATVREIAGKKKVHKAKDSVVARLDLDTEARKITTAGARQTSAGDRRRKSKVIAIATRDSAYKHEPRQRELPAPSSFYFPNVPNKENEETINRMSTRKSSFTGTDRQFKEGNSNDNSKNNNNINIDERNSNGKVDNNKGSNNISQARENKENNDRKNTPLFQKAKRNVCKASFCLTGCFDESSYKMQLMQDNADTNRGQRRSSEFGAANVETKVVADAQKQNTDNDGLLGKNSFDPYKGDPLPKAQPTVLQFIDGTEKELAFNPVWRESHDGTYHDSSTTAGARRQSDPSTAPSSATSEQRRASDPGQRDTVPSRRFDDIKRVSDPPSQMRDVRSTNEDDPAVSNADSASQDHVPYPPGGVNGDTRGDRGLSKEEDMYDQRNSSDKQESTQHRFSSDMTNGNSMRGSTTSLATSQESTYWKDYYKEEAQILHHEDSYLDRITYDSHHDSKPEPSPMANNSTATPVVALFGREKSTSLLGNMATSPESIDQQHSPEKLLPNEPPFENTSRSIANRPSTYTDGASDVEIETIDEVMTKQASARDPQKEEAKFIDSLQQQRESVSVDLVKASSSSVVGDETKTTEGGGRGFGQSDEYADEKQAHSKKTVVSQVDQPLLCSKSEEEFDELMEKPRASSKSADINELAKHDVPTTKSFLDRRISADQVLVQTMMIKDISKSVQPRLATFDIRAALLQTPKTSRGEQSASFGSAFSYKDKDVFTPLTSLVTYPKGSPFRPRLNAPGMAMAKAKLNQPAMFSQSFDNMSRGSRDMMQIYATESAPSMIETNDYRDIALGCYLEGNPSTAANKTENALARRRSGCMSMESPMSATMSPAQPLLSDQVMDNAAFLFSPSYASANSLLTMPAQAEKASQHDDQLMRVEQEPKRESNYSITTLGSRNRVSGRSYQPITIPASRNSNSLSVLPDETNKPRSVYDGASQKSVRFSEANSITESDAGSQKSNRSVTWDFSLKTAPTGDVNIPAIETKVSDLSDTIFGGGRESLESSASKRESVDSFKLERKVIEEEEPDSVETDSLTVSETASRPSLASTKLTKDDSQSFPEIAGTPEQNTRTWTYCEFTKGVTPMLDKKQLSHVTHSPVQRFKAAKNKFVVKQEDKTPVKKSSTLYKRNAGTGRVHLLASQFDNGGRPALEPDDTAPSSSRPHNPVVVSSASETTTMPSNRPMLRTPQILGYTAKTYPSIFQRASFDSVSSSLQGNNKSNSLAPGASYKPTMMATAAPYRKKSAPFDELPHDVSDDSSQSSNESTLVQSVATIRQEGRESRHSRENVVVVDDNDEGLDEVLDEILESEGAQSSCDITKPSGDDLPCDEADDDFAQLLLNKLLGEESSKGGEENTTVSSAGTRQSSQQLHHLRSMISNDESEGSTFSDILAARTFSDESTTISAVLAQQTTAKLRYGAQTVKPQIQTVKPHIQTQEQADPSTESLFLSPLQRTSIQASKWRELADKAQKQDSKRGIFRSGKKTSRKGELRDVSNL